MFAVSYRTSAIAKPLGVTWTEWYKLEAFSRQLMSVQPGKGANARDRNDIHRLTLVSPPPRRDTHAQGIELDKSLRVLLVVGALVVLEGGDAFIEQAVAR